MKKAEMYATIAGFNKYVETGDDKFLLKSRPKAKRYYALGEGWEEIRTDKPKLTKRNSYVRRIGTANGGDKYGWGKRELHTEINGENKCDVCGKTLWLTPGGDKYCDDCVDTKDLPEDYNLHDVLNSKSK